MFTVNKYVNIYLQKENSHELPSCFSLNSPLCGQTRWWRLKRVETVMMLAEGAGACGIGSD